MLVKIKRRVFDSIDDALLIWTCIEPTIQQIRGKSFIVKSEASTHLTTGQRALLMFQMLYGHTGNGVVEFYSHLSYLLSQKGVWTELKNGIQYFRDYAMLHLLDEIEEVYNILKENNSKENSDWLDVINIDKDSNLQLTISRLDKYLYEILPTSIKLIGTYIRNYPDEFVQVED